MELLAGLGGLGVLIFLLVLFVLGVLLPFFVYLSYGELKNVNKNLINLEKRFDDWMHYLKDQNEDQN